MNTSEWFSYQLKASMDGFVWAVEQVQAERRTSTPPKKGLGEWNVARHIFHMVHYERTLPLPHMKYWLEGPSAPLPLFDEHGEERAWEREGQATSIEHLLQEFQQVRAAQIELLPRFDEALWNEIRASDWGEKSIRWIVSKTFQHTADHTNTILCMALFW